MPRQRHTDAEREEALRLVAEVGQAEAARRTGIPAGTIASWAHRHGVASPDAGTTAKASAASVATRKQKLAEGLLRDIERLRERLFAPHTQRKPMVVSDGARDGSHIEVADVELEQLPPGDQKLLMTAIAIAVDKVQILTGEATERIEQVAGEPTVAERAERARQVVDQLAEKREQRATGTGSR